MSASGKSVDNVHLDGEEESHLVLKGFTEQEMQEFDDEDIELGDIHIENTQYAHGLEDVNLESVGSVQVPLNSYERSIAVDNSSVETIRGDLSGRTVIEDSDIGKIRGDSSFSGDFARNSHNLNIHGNIEFQDGHNTRISDPAFFKNSNLPTVIGKSIEGDATLDKNSVGGLVVADNIDVGETKGNFFTISTEDIGWGSSQADEKFPARKGDGYEKNWQEWQDFKQTLKQREDEIYGIPILNPDGIIPRDDSERERFRELTDTDVSDDDAERFVDRFFIREQMMQEILEENLEVDPQSSMNVIAERIGNLAAFTDFENERYASLLNLTLQAQESEAEKLGEFGEIIDGDDYSDGIEAESKYELLERLENHDLLDVANHLRYDLEGVLRGELEEIVNTQKELPDVSELKENWEEWDAWNNGYISLGGMLERAYEENEEDVANLVYLAEFLGEELKLDTEEWVAEQKERKSADKEYEIDGVEDVEQALEEELEDEKRKLTLKSLEKLGKYDAVPTLNGEYKFTPFLTSEKQDKGFIEFTGDEEEWQEFVDKLDSLPIDKRENNSRREIYNSLHSGQLDTDFFGITLLEPGIEKVDSWEDFQSIEEESQDALYAEFNDVESNLEEIANENRHVRSYDFLAPRHKSQILSKLVEDTANEDDTKGRDVSNFGNTLQRLEESTREELFEVLKTDKDEAVVAGEVNEHGQEAEYGDGDDKFGNSLFDIAVNREYSFFVDDEADRIEDLLETKGDLPETDPFFEEDSPYREIVEELTSPERLENGEDSEYGEMSDQELAEKLRMVRGLGERLGFDYNASNVFGMLKGKEGQRQNTDFKPDENEIESLLANRREELEQDVQNKLREYVKQGIQNLGFEAAVDEYEEATGQRTEDLDQNEISALKVRKRFSGRKVETVDTLLEHQNDVYELEENQEWLEQHGFSQGELIDPDLSTQADGEYRRPEDPEYNSELQVEVDPSDVQMDTESEKQQYWNEVTELLDRVGVEDEIEDIEEAEQAIEELEEPEDEQDYQELKDAINNYHSVENRAGGIPDELTLRVADPMDTTRMGQGFGSCHDIDGGSYAWASISNAVDANKMIFYAEDEQGRERARVKAFITEDEELIYHNTSQYKDIDIDTGEYFEDYMERVSDELGLELKHSSEASGWKQRTELLEAHDWYSGS